MFNVLKSDLVKFDLIGAEMGTRHWLLLWTAAENRAMCAKLCKGEWVKWNEILRHKEPKQGKKSAIHYYYDVVKFSHEPSRQEN